ncbi:MAG: flagellar biosynthetic protein FliO [Clostridia bacterium]|nr:flagellar biosynthetic protein FliO [Clostridia bacterium]
MTDFLQVFGILIVFGALLFLAFVTTKYIGTKAGKAMRGRYVSIVESVSIGLDKQLHLVKAGHQYVLIATSGKTIQYLTTVEIDEAEDIESSESTAAFDFRSIFENYLQTFKNIGKTQARKQGKEPQETLEASKFRQNLKKLRSISGSYRGEIKSDGDETTNEK